MLRGIILTAGRGLGAALFSAFAWTRLIPALRAARSGVPTRAKVIRIDTRVDRRGVARPRPVVAFTTQERHRIVCDLICAMCGPWKGLDHHRSATIRVRRASRGELNPRIASRLLSPFEACVRRRT